MSLKCEAEKCINQNGREIIEGTLTIEGLMHVACARARFYRTGKKRVRRKSDVVRLEKQVKSQIKSELGVKRVTKRMIKEHDSIEAKMYRSLARTGK